MTVADGYCVARGGTLLARWTLHASGCSRWPQSITPPAIQIWGKLEKSKFEVGTGSDLEVAIGVVLMDTEATRLLKRGRKKTTYE
jgi:hypothetical protein